MTRLLIFIVAFVVILFAGCFSQARLEGLAPVSGTVTLDDQPFEGAMVNLHPINVENKRPRLGLGMTDNTGHFDIMTLQPKDGVYLGEYKVTVSKTIAIPKVTPEQEQKLIQQGKPIPEPDIKELVPLLYTDVATTPLTTTIGVKGEKNLTIELKSKP
ncbi:MAG: hypothetical protein LBE12_17650 [Planctomycetaceae bacterium]|jgi:hypothetical protein|nr:hypothetical protein [Planctomycetaceae bacterium]